MEGKLVRKGWMEKRTHKKMFGMYEWRRREVFLTTLQMGFTSSSRKRTLRIFDLTSIRVVDCSKDVLRICLTPGTSVFAGSPGSVLYFRPPKKMFKTVNRWMLDRKLERKEDDEDSGGEEISLDAWQREITKCVETRGGVMAWHAGVLLKQSKLRGFTERDCVIDRRTFIWSKMKKREGRQNVMVTEIAKVNKNGKTLEIVLKPDGREVQRLKGTLLRFRALNDDDANRWVECFRRCLKMSRRHSKILRQVSGVGEIEDPLSVSRPLIEEIEVSTFNAEEVRSQEIRTLRSAMDTKDPAMRLKNVMSCAKYLHVAWEGMPAIFHALEVDIQLLKHEGGRNAERYKSFMMTTCILDEGCVDPLIRDDRGRTLLDHFASLDGPTLLLAAIVRNGYARQSDMNVSRLLKNRSFDETMEIVEEELAFVHEVGETYAPCFGHCCCTSGNKLLTTVSCKIIQSKRYAVRWLSLLRDVDGRELQRSAVNDVRALFDRELLFFERFEIDDGAPEHVSDTSVVLLGYDPSPPEIFGSIFDEYAGVSKLLTLEKFQHVLPIAMGSKPNDDSEGDEANASRNRHAYALFARFSGGGGAGDGEGGSSKERDGDISSHVDGCSSFALHD
eukprot:g5273.t1